MTRPPPVLCFGIRIHHEQERTAPTCLSTLLPALRSAVARHSCPPGPRRSRRPLRSSRPHLAVPPPRSSRPLPAVRIPQSCCCHAVQPSPSSCSTVPRTLLNPRPRSNPRSTYHAVIVEKERVDVSMFVSIDGDWFLPPSTLLMSHDPDRDQAGFILDCTI
ncbi:hypothetical protein GQ55_7G072600 [Panicum hallii var. hallii]|uniref:Uncharacterized protein n=1 Tax=Panicum hallii var. hallii TaxID=1504633 RepID=A0A2T7CSS8_9POAL|nr:hypothetical protein GQ55_7G072600 [Panicum hallii var. hallii]